MMACNRSCRALSGYDVSCDADDVPVDGCGCADTTYMNSDDCTEEGKVLIYCSQSLVSTTKRTCEGLNKPEIFSENCKSGCYCPEGRYEDHNGVCVSEEDCTCMFGGKVYQRGDTVINNCQDCRCGDGKWNCTGTACPGKCQVYGDGHYQTFDLNWYRYDGNCPYTLVEDDCGYGNGSFHIWAESVPCCDEALTCSRTLTLDLVGQVTLTLVDMTVKVKPLTRTCEAKPMYSVHTVGLYIIISAPELGITLIWDKHTRATIILDAKWKNKVCGLCGNFDSNAKNDLLTRAKSSVTDVLEFGNSWKTPGALCSDTVNQTFPCQRHSYCSTWAVRRCRIILDPTFEPCHGKVEARPYYDACVEESCSCEMEGKFLGFCTAVAAYAEACSEMGVCIKWRTPDLCPVYCDYYNEAEECSWHYDPCGSVQTCGKNNRFPGKLEGCYPRCPTETPYFDENTGKCSTLGKCSCWYNEEVLKAGDIVIICDQYCHHNNCHPNNSNWINNNCDSNNNNWINDNSHPNNSNWINNYSDSNNNWINDISHSNNSQCINNNIHHTNNSNWININFDSNNSNWINNYSHPDNNHCNNNNNNHPNNSNWINSNSHPNNSNWNNNNCDSNNNTWINDNSHPNNNCHPGNSHTNNSHCINNNNHPNNSNWINNYSHPNNNCHPDNSHTNNSHCINNFSHPNNSNWINYNCHPNNSNRINNNCDSNNSNWINNYSHPNNNCHPDNKY
ncbi:mucin-19-like [Amia ocellicauda]|uniref:mucin-19-like n=1 Tax=Amia ocellicauda TaxID=2972642 RepID=UPI0034649F20